MERLTEKHWRNLDPWECCGLDDDCRRGCHDEGGCTKGCIVPKIYDRLAAYEDTGLTPEEITDFQENYRAMVSMFADYKAAEVTRRLVVLPCPPDAVFYQWKKGDDCPSVSRFEGVEISEDGEIIYPMKRWGETFTMDDFGKTVFLTREDAEKALGELET